MNSVRVGGGGVKNYLNFQRYNFYDVLAHRICAIYLSKYKIVF